MSDGKRKGSDSEETDAKKSKTDEENNEKPEPEQKLKLFVPEKVINSNSARKSINVLGKLTGKSGAAVVILEKTPLRDEHVERPQFYTDEACWDLVLENDIYSVSRATHFRVGSLKATLTYPATEKHIKRFSQQHNHIVAETPKLYKELSLPVALDEQFNLQWVHNILDGTREKERIVFDDPDEETGFVIVPDLKWDGTSPETLYLLAIVRKKGIKCLRDLDSSHLPLLKNVREKGKKAICEKYNLTDTRLRIFLHYHPSFYHLHIHFSYIQYDAPGIHVERAHLLDTVIYNIELQSNYYKMATLPFIIRTMDTLYKAYETAGHVISPKPVEEKKDEEKDATVK